MNAETPQLSVAEKPEKRHMSRGEKLFDSIVYGPVAFIGSFVLSAVFAVLQKRKAPFIHENAVDWLKSIKVPEKMADAFAPVILTSWGGTLAIIPIKWAEDRKAALVKKFNHWFGDKSDPANVKPAVKQTWGSLIASRLTVMALITPVMSAIGGIFGPQMGEAEHRTGVAVAKWLKYPTHRNMPSTLLAEKAGLELLAKGGSETAKKNLTRAIRAIEKHETVPYTLGRMLAVDAIVTVAAIAVLYVTSRFFGKKTDQASLPVDEQKPAEKISISTMPPSTKRHADKVPAASFAARIASQQITETPMRST